jgi:two-component system response regulator DctR
MNSPPPMAPAAPLGLPMVYLVDDEDVIRDALGWLLRSRRLLYEGFASAEAFEAMLDERRNALPDGPRCLVLDIRMTGKTGVALFDALIERDLVEDMPVIFLTGQGDVPTAVAALKRGAFDFVEKPFSNNQLLDRILMALERSTASLSAKRAGQSLRARLAQLSERERQVLDLVVIGRANKQVADELGLSVRTVEVHRARVFDKMGVNSAVELSNLLRGLTP